MSQLRSKRHSKIEYLALRIFLFYYYIIPYALGGSITPSISSNRLRNDKFERSKRISWLSFDSIEESKILVVGAGALGNEVSKNLMLSGFGNITIVDMDKIEHSNLNRCIFFSDSDARLKRNKAEVVAEKLRTFNENLKVTFHPKKIQELPEDIIPSHDLVFGCLDNIETRLHVNAFCYHHKIPYIDGATNGFLGKVQVIVPPDSPCLECALNKTHMRILEKRYSCTGSQVTLYDERLPQEITTTSVIAAIQVREGLKIVSKNENILSNKIFFYNGLRNISEELEIEINLSCQHHNFE
jgi:molybdopterin/thiamine biosynthesis adenylyltransferase